jgi:hypothetical protein
MANNVNPLNSVTDGIQPLMRQLARVADANGDGQVSTEEFGTFLTQMLRSGGASTNSLKTLASTAAAAASSPLGFTAGADSYLDRLEGFDLSRMENSAHSPKYAFANLAKGLAPTPENLRVIAEQLGPSKGFLEADGLSYILYDSNGYVGVRDRGNGPIWQWMAYNEIHPDPLA